MRGWKGKLLLLMGMVSIVKAGESEDDQRIAAAITLTQLQLSGCVMNNDTNDFMHEDIISEDTADETIPKFYSSPLTAVLSTNSALVSNILEDTYYCNVCDQNLSVDTYRHTSHIQQCGLKKVYICPQKSCADNFFCASTQQTAQKHLESKKHVTMNKDMKLPYCLAKNIHQCRKLIVSGAPILLINK